MSNGHPPRKDKEPAKPTWTDRSVPATVKPELPPQAFDPNDTNALVPAADPVVQAAYKRTGHLPVRPTLARAGGSDALVIQKSAKLARVLNFRVEGVQWRAGFAPEVGQTPLAQFIQDQLPPAYEVQTGTGFTLRPTDPELESVLRDIIPGTLLKLEEDMFGRHRELGRPYLYFIPHANGATAGMLAWYVLGPLGKAHLLYLQTELKRADVRILDAMLGTFRASLVAREQAGPTPQPFNFWQELGDAQTRVEISLRNSALGNGEVLRRVDQVRNQAEARLFRQLDTNFGRASKLLATIFVHAPQKGFVGLMRVLSRGAVRVINGVDRLLARPEDEPPF